MQHQSKFKGASRHGKNPQSPKEYGRFLRHEGGVVPQSENTPEEQLKYLETMGWTATKERAKIDKKIKLLGQKTDKKETKKRQKNDKRGNKE